MCVMCRRRCSRGRSLLQSAGVLLSEQWTGGRRGSRERLYSPGDDGGLSVLVTRCSSRGTPGSSSSTACVWNILYFKLSGLADICASFFLFLSLNTLFFVSGFCDGDGEQSWTCRSRRQDHPPKERFPAVLSVKTHPKQSYTCSIPAAFTLYSLSHSFKHL